MGSARGERCCRSPRSMTGPPGRVSIAAADAGRAASRQPRAGACGHGSGAPTGYGQRSRAAGRAATHAPGVGAPAKRRPSRRSPDPLHPCADPGGAMASTTAPPPSRPACASGAGSKWANVPGSLPGYIASTSDSAHSEPQCRSGAHREGGRHAEPAHDPGGAQQPPSPRPRIPLKEAHCLSPGAVPEACMTQRVCVGRLRSAHPRVWRAPGGPALPPHRNRHCAVDSGPRLHRCRRRPLVQARSPRP